MQIVFDPSNLEDIKAVKDLIEPLGFKDVGKKVAQEPVIKESSPTKIDDANLDSNGVEYNRHIHGKGKLKTQKGLWRRQKGISIEEYNKHASLFTRPAPAPVAPAPAPVAPAPAPVAAPVADNLLEEIDNLFAELEAKEHTNDFSLWAAQMLEWAKPGTKTVMELDGDIEAQKKLKDHLLTV